MDDELLQELLARASSLYNNGDYQGAIDAWNEVLQADPANSKAREGIQMSHLLIGDLVPGPDAGDGQPPADGGEPANVALTPREVETRLSGGLARVKALMAERKFPEALEGARSLVPIDPGSEEVQRLIEEAQQSFESAPFIEEHLTLARELMAQERHHEAEAECHKVFALDRSNPDAAELLRQMRKPVPPVAEAARARKGSGTTGPAPGPPALGGTGGDDDLDLIDLPTDTSATTPEPGDAGSAGGADPEIVEAREVVPPAVRSIPASEDDEAAKARLLEEPALLERAAGQKGPAEWEGELARLNLREEENDLLGKRQTARRAVGDDPDPAAVQDADADLMSLLDQEFDGSAGAMVTESDADPDAMEPLSLDSPGHSHGEPVMEEDGPPADYDLPAAPRMGKTTAAPALEAPVEEMPAEPDFEPQAAPEPEPESPPVRRRVAPARQAAGRSSIPKYFALLGIVILLSGGTAWWFLIRPSAAGAHGDPGGAATPPAGSSSSPPASADAGPIPTPIGGPSRKPVQPATGNEAAVPTVPLVEVVPDPEPEVDTRATTALTPQEVERRVASHLSRGRRLLAQEDWQGVRQEMRAAMALDPFNLQVRELSDRADAKIEEQEALLREFAEVRRMFDAKDYQGTLWKLYRIRRDPALGDVERYIRNTWYNWAVTSMRGGNNGDALEKVGEALATDPQDGDARKLQGFAERYAARAKDDVYYAFADTIELRALDEK
jgi:tetratricopeptide (TPR) repeat protein